MSPIRWAEDPITEIDQVEALEGLQLMIRDKLLPRVGELADACSQDVVRLLQAMGNQRWTDEPIRSCADIEAGAA